MRHTVTVQVDELGAPLRFYYTREPGPEGQLLTDDGDAPGVSLAALLRATGPMPDRAVLELISYLADILTISEEDRAVHGAISPEGIFIDEGGAVSIAGWMAHPRPTRAPEGRAVGPSTDVFGIGEVMLSAMTGRPLAEAPPNDRGVYDDHILGRLSEVDWAAMGQKKWVGEVQHFVCAMLAHGPEERPQSLDIANVLGGVATVAPGDDLTVWSDLVMGADLNARWDQEPLGRPASLDAPQPEPSYEEDLGGPQAIGDSPVSKTAALRLRKAASAKGESTAFWSRDKIAALLEDDDDDEPVRATFVPTGRAGRTAPPPSPGRFDASTQRAAAPPPPMPPSSFDAPTQRSPAPPRPTGLPARPPAPPAPSPPIAAPPTPPTASPVAVAPPPPQPSPMPTPASVVSGPTPPTPIAARPVSPIAVAAPGVPVADPSADSGEKGSSKTPLIIGLVVGFVVLCMGLPLVGGGVWYFLNSDVQNGGSDAAEVDTSGGGEDAAADEPPADDSGDTEDADAAKAEEERKAAEAEAARKAERDKKKSSSSSSRRGSSTSGRSSSSGSRSGASGSRRGSSSSSSSSSRRGSSGSGSSGSGTGSTSSGGTFPATVRFVHDGVETTLSCGDGQQRVFVGSTRMTFNEIATCRVDAGGQRTVVQVRKAGTSTCAVSGNKLRCSAP